MRSFTFTSCALYFLTGLTGISIGSVLPELLRYYHLSYTVSGQMIFIGATGFITGVLFSSWLNRHLKPRLLLTLATVIIAFAQFSLFTLPPFPIFLMLFFLNSIGTAAIGIVVATLVIEVFIGRQAVAMSYLEVSYGIGAFVMPFMTSFLIAWGIWRFLFLLNAVLALCLSVVCARLSYSQNNETEEPLDAACAASPGTLTAHKKVLILSLFAVGIFLYGGLEGSLNNFLSSIFMNYLDLVAYYASISVGIFWGAMVVGRALTGFIIRKVTYSKYLLLSITGAIVSLILLIILKNVWLGFGFIAFLGLTMSGLYSITFVYANYSIPKSAGLVTPIISGLCGLGAAIWPAFTGISIDHFGMHATLWYIVVIAASYLITLLLINCARRGRLPRFRLPVYRDTVHYRA